MENPATHLKPRAPVVSRDDYILLFVDNLSIADIGIGGLVFIITYLSIYVLLLIWAHVKDKQKQTFSSKIVSTPNTSQSQINIPRRANFRAINIDITSDTLDFTNQSVRMNFDDQKDMSGIFHKQDADGMATISPIHKSDQQISIISPNNVNEKGLKFNMVRTPQRIGGQKIDLEGTLNPPLSSTDNEDRVTTGKEDTNTNKDEGTLRKDISNIMEDFSRDDEFVYKQQQQQQLVRNNKAKEPSKKAKAKEKSGAKVVTRARQSVRSKFIKLLAQRHVILSTIERMSRISPRYKRISLIYFLLSVDLFGVSLSFIDFSIFANLKIWQLLKVTFCGWIMFMLISWLSSVSKEGLKNTRTNEEFIKMLSSLEKEAHYKDIMVHVMIGLFLLVGLTQFGLFITVKREYALAWCLCSIGVFITQMVFLDAFWLLIIAHVYIKAYDSQGIKRFYRRMNAIRFWRI